MNGRLLRLGSGTPWIAATKGYTVPTINIYLEPENTIPAQDVKKIADKIKGKTRKLILPQKFLNADKVKPSFKLKTELITWAVKDFGLGGATKKTLVTDAKMQGKLSTIGFYDLYFTVTADVAGQPKSFRIKGDLEIAAKDPIAAPEPCEITYVNAKVRRTCEGDRNLLTKINSIALAGTSETGHGAVPYLSGALHAHATNTLSVAWKWKSGKMHIVASGKKNNENRQQQRGGTGRSLRTMQYDWDEG